jgi:hypothetical protein
MEDNGPEASLVLQTVHFIALKNVELAEALRNKYFEAFGEVQSCRANKNFK